MRKITALFLSIVTLALSTFTAACKPANPRRQALEKALAAERARYPQCTLMDIYKFFFQGAFGPGHMIPDANMARQYLASELSQATEFDSLLSYPVGVSGEYYRVSLKAVQEGKISAEELLQAFVASANAAPVPAVQEWQAEWREIVQVIEERHPAMPNFAADRARLEEMLARGELVVHHSEVFEEKYHPHYRIIHRSQLQKLPGILEGSNF